jgi:hypothetical protein
MAFTIKVAGLDAVMKRFNELPKIIQKEITGELKLSAEEVRRLAIKDAPGDQGRLRQSITVNQSTGIAFTTTVQNNYAAYMEWGTKRKAKVPSELQAYAATFKGKGDTGGDMDAAILAWVKRKGIAGTYSVKTRRRTGNKATKDQQDKQAAFLIARSIRKKGVTPHPFFFKNVFLVRDKLRKRIETIINNL